ncbi:unnamed protein product [Caenorhabditis bovis]|uniref:Cytochrome P450 n=1 Tax=Caenorhabditis bovis TaxID=2654633 RepID=A0A8S1F2U0_9PELO|nr:unnamed protein product [Caenorhabditis bovis]
MSLAALLCISAFVGFISYYIYNWLYWRRRGIAGPLGYPFIGLSWQMLSHRYSPYVKLGEWTKKYGKVWGYTEGASKVLVISDADLVNEVFVKQFDNFYGRKKDPLITDVDTDPRVHLFHAEGARWKRLRNISSPTFSNNSLKKLKNTIEESAFELLRHFEKNTANGEQIDVLLYYQEFTLDVIGRIAMGQHTTKMFENPLIESVKGIFGNDRWPIILLAGTFPILAKTLRNILLTFPKFVGGNPIVNIINICTKAVEDRIRQRELDLKNGIENQEPADFVDLFLDARADGDLVLHQNSDFSLSNVKVNRQLTKQEIVAQLMVFMVAGFDTTALSLSYTSFLLATHPEIQRKVQEEMNRECPDPEVTFDQLSKLKYLDCVIRETLRLYPLGELANARRCINSTEIGGIPIERGTEILVDTWTIHHDPNIWGADADEFKPERWENGDETFPRGAYIPFGYGPRQCIGMRLAYMEERLLLTHILRKYSFTTGPKTQNPLKLVGRATIQPETVFLHLNPLD